MSQLTLDVMRASVSAGFDLFWKIYPRKVAKEAARRMWRKALKLASEDEIIAGANRYARERAGQDPAYTKHPATWLHGGCWGDEPAPRGKAKTGSGFGSIVRQAMEDDDGQCDDAGSEQRGALPARIVR